MRILIYIFNMLTEIRAKYYKRISSIVLGTYSALLIVISLHFHNIYSGRPEIIAQQKSASADFSDDTLYSGGNFCQFLLNYKTNVDPSGIEAPDIKLTLTGEQILPADHNQGHLWSIESINLRAPPSAPLFV